MSVKPLLLHFLLHSEREVRLVHLFNENLTGLYGQPPCAPAHAIDDRTASLPPRLRPVLRQLLAGDSEKQAAFKLGLSPHTVHQYAKVLYRTFHVNSRSELLAQFVVQ